MYWTHNVIREVTKSIDTYTNLLLKLKNAVKLNMKVFNSTFADPLFYVKLFQC